MSRRAVPVTVTTSDGGYFRLTSLGRRVTGGGARADFAHWSILPNNASSSARRAHDRRHRATLLAESSCTAPCSVCIPPTSENCMAK
jgi:hypothetical protein